MPRQRSGWPRVAPDWSRGSSSRRLEPAEELAEIETALVRAERLAASPGHQEAGGNPFESERRAGTGGVLFDQHAGAAPPAAPSPAASEVEIELALEQADGGAPTELFDFEHAA